MPGLIHGSGCFVATFLVVPGLQVGEGRMNSWSLCPNWWQFSVEEQGVGLHPFADDGSNTAKGSRHEVFWRELDLILFSDLRDHFHHPH